MNDDFKNSDPHISIDGLVSVSIMTNLDHSATAIISSGDGNVFACKYPSLAIAIAATYQRFGFHDNPNVTGHLPH